ncbi:hypothetical protein Poly30_44430 [Planctomycetes bacterium Poly30]|uniref:DUF4412 domain-containing protein n=1 Tax=Saltatorellus ferox TaxID=2528018 RepID=A0A518EXS8_9BACT|nr:hypothetical protein Poly30_44430 [Planctomycetes bacterium Poly30]
MTLFKTAATLSVPAVALSFLVGFSGSSTDKIAFTPAEGVTVTKTFTTTTTMEMDDMTALMNGGPSPMPEMEMSMEMAQSVTVTDEYVSMADGKPKKLARTFDAIGSDLEMEVNAGGQAQSPNGSGSSPLEGSTVVFTWNAETEEYEIAFAEGEEGDVDLLEGLKENMDLRGLLPKEELAEGDAYDIDLSAFVDILSPGGNLKLEMEIDGEAAGSGMDPEMMTDFSKFFEDLLEGSATGKYVGTRDVDGVKVAVIELNVEIDASADMAELAAESMGDEMPEGIEMSIDHVDVEMSYSGTGELLWNMSKGVIHSFEMNADMEMNMDMGMNMAMGGQEMEISMEMAMSGSVKNTVTTE